MLLTKPLTAFLAQNLTPELHTLFLCTLSGKLLASSSQSTAKELRSQATLASTLYAIYRPLIADGTLYEALPGSSTNASEENGETVDEESHGRGLGFEAITIQLEGGTFIVRYLMSGLLLVAIGPPPFISAPSSSYNPTSSSTSLYTTYSAARGTPSGSPKLTRNGGGSSEHERMAGVNSSAASIAESTSTVSPEGRSYRKMKRRVEKLAAVLEDELKGFGLGDAL